MATAPKYTIEVSPDGIRLVDAKNGGAIAQDENPLYAAFVGWVADGNAPTIQAVEAAPDA